MVLTQRVIRKADGSSQLVIDAEPQALAELLGLADELNLRSTVTTEGPIHILNDPMENGPNPMGS